MIVSSSFLFVFVKNKNKNNEQWTKMYVGNNKLCRERLGLQWFYLSISISNCIYHYLIEFFWITQFQNGKKWKMNEQGFETFKCYKFWS